MNAFIEGLFFGVVLALMIGPVFFILVQTSIERGVLHGLSVAFGESVSDMLFLLIYYIGFSHVSLNDSFSKTLGVSGVMILLIIGVLMIRNAKNKWKFPGPEKAGISKLSCFLKGFLINSFNPFVYVFWAGVMGVLKSKYAAFPDSIFMFCVGIFAFKLFADIVKALSSSKIKRLVSNAVLQYITAATGGILIIYAVVLFYRLFSQGF